MHNANELAGENAKLKIALQRANELTRSTYQVARREGDQTNWKEFRGAIERELEEQHRILKKLGLRSAGVEEESRSDPVTGRRPGDDKLIPPAIVLHGLPQSQVDALKASGLNVISEDEFFARKDLTKEEFNRGIQCAVEAALEVVTEDARGAENHLMKHLAQSIDEALRREGYKPASDSYQSDKTATQDAQEGEDRKKAETSLPPEAFGPGFWSRFFSDEACCGCEACEGKPNKALVVSLGDVGGPDLNGPVTVEGLLELLELLGLVDALPLDAACDGGKTGGKLAQGEQPRARGEVELESIPGLEHSVFNLLQDANALDELAEIADSFANLEVENQEGHGWLHKSNAFIELAAAADRLSALLKRVNA